LYFYKAHYKQQSQVVRRRMSNVEQVRLHQSFEFTQFSSVLVRHKEIGSSVPKPWTGNSETPLFIPIPAKDISVWIVERGHGAV